MPFNRLNHDVLGEIRPRFRLSSSLSRQEVFARIKEHLTEDDTVKGQVLEHYAILRIPPQEAHYWSPELQIRIDEFETSTEEQTVIKCLVGPKQSVWVLFAFFYGVLGLAAFFGGSYGAVQLTLGHTSPFIWLLPIGVLLIPGIWLIAKAGQRTGRDQMLHLISFLYHSLDAHGALERVE